MRSTSETPRIGPPDLPDSPNHHLIGDADARRLLDTPALCIDLDALERNIAAMAAHARAAGVALRPHAKTHKSVRIARLQQEAGAIGTSCATLGEAEAMLRSGLAGILVTSPQVTSAKLRRIAALNAMPHRGLMVVADDADAIDGLAAAARQSGRVLPVLVDHNAGHHRTGVAGAADVLALARRIDAADGLVFAGVQHYSGNVQHLASRAERRRAALERLGGLKAIVQSLESAGLLPGIVTGAGTGTFDIDPEAGVFTELQCGSYVFMDVDYQRALLDGRNAPPFETALFVATAVVSRNALESHGWVTVDGGLKCFATDGPAPEPFRGAPAGAAFQFFGDEHGRMVLPKGTALPALGSRVEWVTPHCDPTVNLHDWYHVFRGERLVDIWPIEARGKR
jgi:D-serine deaminase-like pyridoxal phosphate-dependent protein